MLDIDSTARLLPLLADADEHGDDEVIPRPHHAPAIQRLAHDAAARIRVECDGGTGEPSGIGRTTRDRHDVAASLARLRVDG